MSVSAGLIRLATEATGADGDTGPILSVSPQWKFFFSPMVRLYVAADLDLLRTDFNQDHTRTNHNFSVLASIELAF